VSEFGSEPESESESQTGFISEMSNAPHAWVSRTLLRVDIAKKPGSSGVARFRFTAPCRARKLP
jgi:hypothetical protein